jgi:FKBP-type peptidyl-prolyl cis-trans isomerase FklB
VLYSIKPFKAFLAVSLISLTALHLPKGRNPGSFRTFVQNYFYMTEEIKAVSYCVGMSIAGSLLDQKLDGINPDVVAEAINDMFEGKEPKFSPEEANSIIQKYVSEAQEKNFGVFKEEGEAFLSTNKLKPEITTTESGLQFEVIEEGTGNTPGAQDSVKVHYHGTLIDGTTFDSSVERGEPATFGVHQVIPGWTEALQLMKAGSKYRLYVPQDLAYGANPHPS